MKHLKKYEGLFDFFKKKKVNKEEKSSKEILDDNKYVEENLEEVNSCFLELNDQNIFVETELSSYFSEHPPLDVVVYQLHVFLWKSQFTYVNDYTKLGEYIKLEDLMETFRFADSYLKDFGLKIHRYGLFIDGEYDNSVYSNYIYYDDIKELEGDLDKDGTKHIEIVEVLIRKT